MRVITANSIQLLIIVVLALILLRQCNKAPETITKTVTEVKRVLIKGEPDTLYFERIKVVHDSLYFVRVDSLSNDSITAFKTLINDSLIEGEIITKTKGELESVYFNYLPKFPKHIYRVDTLRVDSMTTITKNPYRFYLGAVVGGSSSSFSLVPTATVKTPKGWLFSGGYDLINKSYHLGVSTELKLFSK